MQWKMAHGLHGLTALGAVPENVQAQSQLGKVGDLHTP